MSADAMDRLSLHDVHVTERRPRHGPLVERLLRGMVHQDARHAAIRLSPEKGQLRYHVAGAWEPIRELPVEIVRDLRGQMLSLFQRAESSCDRGASATIELTIPGLGPAAFRLHAVRSSRWIVTHMPRDEAPISIVDREHERARRDLLEQGRRAVEGGAHQHALRPLVRALAMAEIYGSTAEKLRIELTIGFAYELAERLLDAERVYKRCLKRVETDYGRDDLQRGAIFARLAHCAATRGDRAVAEMWHRRRRDASRL